MNLSQQHEQICKQARELMERKNHDYGDSWRKDRPTTITDTIRHKVDRIINIENLQLSGKETKIAEGIESELIDIINYCVFRVIMERENATT